MKRPRPMARMARAIGCTEGQAYTLTIGTAVAVLLLANTLPAAFRPRPPEVAVAVAPVPTAPGPPAPLGPPPPAAPHADAAAAPEPAPPLGPLGPARGDGREAGAPATPAEARGGPPPPVAPAADAAATPAQPLVVSEAGWATAGAGTPAARAGVPPGSLPVGSGGGTTTRLSFVRLSGPGTVLALAVRPEAEANVNPAGAAVAACPITDPEWQPREAVALTDAPSFDAGRCAGGARQGDGSWRFDLAGFADRAGPAGFALVPAGASSPGFQISFDPSITAPGGSS